jgi:hypothetical protein
MEVLIAQSSNKIALRVTIVDTEPFDEIHVLFYMCTVTL